MDKSSIDENKSIQEGLEKFLEQEISLRDGKEIHGTASNQKRTQTLQEDLINVSRPEHSQTSSARQEEMEQQRQAELRRLRAEQQRKAEQQQKAEQQRQQEEKRRQQEQRQQEIERRRRWEEEDELAEDDWEKDDSILRRERRQPRTKEPARNAKGRTSKETVRGGKNRKNKNTAKSRKADRRNGKNGGKKKTSKAKKVLMILLFVALALLLWWFIMVHNIYNKMNYEKADELVTGSMKEDGVINVLLIGNDSRENGEDGRSDAMILVSISNKTKTIHMTSLLRDMYVEIPGHDGNRLNAAYAYGGASLLCETIEQNLGIEVNRYALVNFQAFANLVDAVDGVDLEVTSEEVKWINAYLNEYNLLEGKEMTTDYLDESLSGELHLNGPQALAYSRNRYIGTDFGRTERQRKVLSAVMKKLPLALATNSSELIDGLFPNLTTNLKQTEVYSLSLDASKLLTYEVVQMAIPAEGTYSNATIRDMAVLQVDFDANKAIIQKEIYGKE